MTAVIWRAVAKDSLRRLSAVAGPAGVVIGRDHSGALASVRLLRVQPTRAAIVGGYWAARVMAFRCLGAGAAVEVVTAAPGRWSGLAESDGSGRFRVIQAGQWVEPWMPQGSARPVVQINDVGAGRAPDRPPLGPWHTSLTVLSSLTSNTAGALADAEIVMLQRLTAAEADACVSALRLPGDAVAKLQQLHDDMVVTVVAGEPRYLWWATTSIENDAFGPAHRDAG
jgi:hypothetical protein